MLVRACECVRVCSRVACLWVCLSAEACRCVCARACPLMCVRTCACVCLCDGRGHADACESARACLNARSHVRLRGVCMCSCVYAWAVACVHGHALEGKRVQMRTSMRAGAHERVRTCWQACISTCAWTRVCLTVLLLLLFRYLETSRIEICRTQSVWILKIAKQQ